MKIKDIFKELQNLAKALDIKIRNDKGRFRTGFAVVNDKRTILINSSAPIETKASYLARAIHQLEIQHNIELPLPVKLYIEEEIATVTNTSESDFKIDLTDNLDTSDERNQRNNRSYQQIA